MPPFDEKAHLNAVLGKLRAALLKFVAPAVYKDFEDTLLQFTCAQREVNEYHWNEEQRRKQEPCDVYHVTDTERAMGMCASLAGKQLPFKCTYDPCKREYTIKVFAA